MRFGQGIGPIIGRVSVLVLLLLAATAARAQSSPSGVWAYSHSNTSVQVGWNPVPGATGYALYAGSASNTISTTPVATTTGLYATHTGLNTGALYHYKVAAFYGTNRSPLSQEVTCRPGTARLAGPMVVAYAGAGQVTLRWSAVPGAQIYRIFRTANGSTWTLAGNVSGPTYIDQGLVDGVQYRYVVRGSSYETDHNNSYDVYAVPGDAALSSPAASWAVAGTSSNSVYWQAVPGAVGYVVFRGTTSEGEGWTPYAITAGTSFSDPGLTSGSTYYYKVAAYDSSSTSLKSPVASATVNSARLLAPILVAAAGASKVTLNWTAVTRATQFLIFRKTVDGAWEYYARTPNRVYEDYAVAPGTAYAYCVYALNDNGMGYVSSTVTAKPGSLAPAAPTGVYAVASNTQISLYWHPVSGAASYNLYRGTVAGKERLYKTSVAIGSTDSGLINNTTYYYKVRAVAKGTEGKASVSFSATPGVARLPGTQVAGYPNAGKIELYWDLVPGAEGYNVFRTDSGAPYRMIKAKVAPAVGATYGAFVDATVTPGLPYSYIVNAVSKDGQGLNSNTVVVTAGNPPLAAPALTYAFAQTSYITLYCTSVLGADSYNVYRSNDPSTFGPMPYKVGSSTTFTDQNVSPGTVYYYKFTAVDEDGQSGFSPVCSATAGTTALSAPILTSNTAVATITLYWSATDGATSYNVFRSVGGGNYTHYRQGVTDLYLADANVVAGQRYSYQIYPVSSRGMGNRSNTVHGRPGSTMLVAPSGVYGYSNGTTAVYLNWEPVLGASSYNVYRSTTSDGQGLVPIAVGVGSAFGDSNLVTGTTYYYRVTAVNSNGQSLKSIEFSATPGTTRLTKVSLYTPTASTGQVAVSWSKNWNATGYHVFRQITGGDWKMIAAYVSNESFLDTDVIAGAEYSYQVAPLNMNGMGNVSNIQKKVAQ